MATYTNMYVTRHSKMGIENYYNVSITQSPIYLIFSHTVEGVKKETRIPHSDIKEVEGIIDAGV